jgi:accessory gene regulator B
LRETIKKISRAISRTNQYTKDEEEQVEYALRIIIFEFLKIVAAIIIFSLIGYPTQAIIAIGTMTLVKPYIGGYHEDTQIKCFTATLVIICSIIYLSASLRLDLIAKLILNAASLYCIWQQAPVINAKMEIKRPELIKRNRIIGITLSIVLTLISIIFSKYMIISNIIVWTMVFQALLMFNKRERTFL